jgi:hypothetical protein
LAFVVTDEGIGTGFAITSLLLALVGTVSRVGTSAVAFLQSANIQALSLKEMSWTLILKAERTGHEHTGCEN